MCFVKPNCHILCMLFPCCMFLSWCMFFLQVFTIGWNYRVSIEVSKTNLCDLCTSTRILKKKEEANIKDQQHPQSWQPQHSLNKHLANHLLLYLDSIITTDAPTTAITHWHLTASKCKMHNNSWTCYYLTPLVHAWCSLPQKKGLDEIRFCTDSCQRIYHLRLCISQLMCFTNSLTRILWLILRAIFHEGMLTFLASFTEAEVPRPHQLFLCFWQIVYSVASIRATQLKGRWRWLMMHFLRHHRSKKTGSLSSEEHE